MRRTIPSKNTWHTPRVLSALAKAAEGLREVETVTNHINLLPDPAERRLSWKYYFACRFAGHPWRFTSEGLRPVIT